jgi:polyhydroxybutyrate depolymerase
VHVSDTPTSTKWIVSGLLLGGVAVISLIVLAASLVGGGGGTASVEVTTTTTSTVVSTTSTTAAAPTVTEPENIDVSRLDLAVGGATRSATVIVPAARAPGDRLPVVMVLHGLGVNANAMSRIADWRTAVARDRFIAVFPQGVNDSWNMGPCCPPANLLGVADTAFLDALVDDLRGRSDADPQRLYMTGFSNGALMVYTYACARSDVFAAIAPMAGTNITGCRPTQPLSLLHQHGDADVIVPYAGGPAFGSLVSSAPFPSVVDSVGDWAVADGCDAEPTVTPEGGVERTRWSGCADGIRVESVRVPGLGHDWLRTATYDPLEELLGFFGIG